MSKSKEQNTAIAAYKDQYVSISNEIARAKEKVSLLEAKIELLAIHHLRKEYHVMVKTDRDGNHWNVKYIEIPAKEIKNLMGRSDSDVYNDIFSASVALKTKLYIIEDRETKEFAIKSMYDDVTYKQGVLRVAFNPEMEQNFLGLSERFTTLSLEIAFSLRKTGALQLYKLLKSEAYRLPALDRSVPQESLPCLELTYSISELRMNLGFVDIEQPKLRHEAEKKGKPNFEKMVKDEKNPKYKRFSDFDARVLKPGREELNAVSDIYISEIKKEGSGRGGKINAVTFVLQWNAAYAGGRVVEADRKPTTESDINSFCDLVMDEMPVKIKINDARAIAQAADYDISKVKRAVELLNESSSDIDNVTGWVIKAIEGEWKSGQKKKGTKKNSFGNFTQNTYDFDELEKKLVAN